MATTKADIHEEGAPSVDEIDLALGLVRELERAGRIEEARAVYKLARAQTLRDDEPYDESDLPPEVAAALEHADAGIASGKIIPHDVVMQGREAVEAYKRRRDAGDVPADVQTAVEVFRKDWEARRPARASDA
jgi:hypothetical protein